MSQDLTVVHHSNMLKDSNRLIAFRNAIKNFVGKESVVVDLGAGTGLLSAYAAQHTQKNVYAIEYYDFGVNICQTIIDSGKSNQIKIVKDASYNVHLKDNPDILISETIGQIGPEENIVELCFDFCRRHPSISIVIPAMIQVFAQFVYSPSAKIQIENILEGYYSASTPEFDYKFSESLVLDELSKIIFQGNLSDAEAVSAPILLAEYYLGKTSDSNFEKVLSANLAFNKANVVHLFFVARLDDKNIVSSRYDEINHWSHSYIPINKEKKNLFLSYKQGSGKVEIHWLA